MPEQRLAEPYLDVRRQPFLPSVVVVPYDQIGYEIDLAVLIARGAGQARGVFQHGQRVQLLDVRGRVVAPGRLVEEDAPNRYGRMVELLEYHSYAPSGVEQLFFVQRAQLFSVHRYAALSGVFKVVHTAYQRALARPGEADYAEYLPLPYGKVDVPQGGNGVRLQAEGLCQPPYGYHFTCFHLFLQSEVLH